MLSLLHIENIAVIEKADIEFGPGLNVLTGETGAGKSIVIDSLGAVLGGRATRELVRTGAETASVTAVFPDTGAEISEWCEQSGIECEEELILMRKINADGKTSCRVNGTPVSASQLRNLGEKLLNIHGQHDGQRLLAEHNHLEYLDSFGAHSKELGMYTECHSRYTAAKAERDSLLLDEGEKARRIDILEFQIDELEQANLKPGEADSLKSRSDFLKNAGKLSEAVNIAFQAIHGGDEGQGAIDLIGEAEQNISYALNFSAEFKDLAECTETLKYSAEDIAEQLMDIKDRLEFSPEEQDKIEERLALLTRILRKYGGDEEAILAMLERLKNELSDIKYSAEKVVKLEKILDERHAKLLTAGKALSDARAKVAKKLEKRIISELEHLSMRGIVFTVEISPRESFDSRGFDQVRFLMSANAGEKLSRISKVASGGELARIMLAMKNVLAESEKLGTMVFDEIDTGVSGIAAQRVGEKLSDLARIRQVLCVTHLPQIAALADLHFSIQKNIRNGRTYTDIKHLDRFGRAEEIARLTGGEHVTEMTLNSAGELLDSAEEYKLTANSRS